MHLKVILSLLLWQVLTVCAEPQEKPTVSHTSERPLLENPAYDPTIYHKFVPQDAVQQYVHSYSGHNYPIGNNPAYGPLSSSSFEPTAYAAIPSKGFEGYLIPAPTALAPAERTTLFGSFRSLIPSARSVASFIGQLVSLVLGSAGAVALGTLLTATLCFFTPSFCTLSFRSGRAQAIAETAQEVVSALGEQVTADRVKRAAEFVQLAIDKFQRLNEAVKQATELKAAIEPNLQ